MTTPRAVAYIGAASLLLAWLAFAAGDARRPQADRHAPASGDAVLIDTIAADVQSQAIRLRQRLATAPAPTPVRNPFTFAERHPRNAARVPAPSPVDLPEPAPAPAPDEPGLALIGIAEQQTDGKLVRTALMSVGLDDLAMVTEGQMVGRYLVVAIGADAVELKDPGTGVIRRFALQQ